MISIRMKTLKHFIIWFLIAFTLGVLIDNRIKFPKTEVKDNKEDHFYQNVSLREQYLKKKNKYENYLEYQENCFREIVNSEGFVSGEYTDAGYWFAYKINDPYLEVWRTCKLHWKAKLNKIVNCPAEGIKQAEFEAGKDEYGDNYLSYFVKDRYNRIKEKYLSLSSGDKYFINEYCL